MNIDLISDRLFLTFPENIRSLFEIHDTKMEDYLEMRRIDPFFKYIFHDNEVLTGKGNHLDFARDINRQLGEKMSALNRFFLQFQEEI